MSAIDEGRAALGQWLAKQPSNFYEADVLLRLLVERTDLGERPVETLREFGAVAAGPLDAAVIENNRPGNLPALETHDAVGRHVAGFAHHPSYHRAGELIYGSGIMAAYAEIPNPHPFILSMFYLSSHVGEGGHNCPLACTAGAIRALQALGTEAQKAAWLPRLLNPVYGAHAAGAQFLTEVQGGSDVGANAVVARQDADGWRIDGEKWFCSSADARVFLMTARPEGAPEGTKGLGLFLVPREVDGEPNGFVLHRLKDKLGTRSMVTAEIEFRGARAEPLGPLEQGFTHTMDRVINTSRLYNAFACAAAAHRAYLVARGYAEHRRAFGETIHRYPLVRETLAMILADAEAALAGSFWLARVQRRVDAGEASDEEAAFLRMGLNLNKVRAAVVCHDAINRGIEILGGNGTVETFSVLPRLLRDNVVFENWEGTHHTLRMQVLRDAHRLRLHEGMFSMLERRLGPEAIRRDREAFAASMDTGETLMLRRVCDRLGTWIHLAALEGIDDSGVRARAELTRLRHLAADPIREHWADLVERCTE